MNGLFKVERTLMVVNITEADGSVHHETAGVMVTVAIGERSWRGTKVGSKLIEASRDALHAALGNYFPDLKKVDVPPGDESEAWAAIVNGYHQQLPPP